MGHRLNMGLDLRSLFGLHVHSCTHWLRPRNSPPPPSFGLIYEGAIGQNRRHLIVTPWIDQHASVGAVNFANLAGGGGGLINILH